MSKLEQAVPRLSKMSSHEAIFLLRNSLAIPKLLYTLRTSPCFSSPILREFDKLVIRTLAVCTNVRMNEASEQQATLPVRWGGLGVRSAVNLAPSAFLASASAAAPLLQVMLPTPVLGSPDTILADALSAWREVGGSAEPPPELKRNQRAWDESVCETVATAALHNADIPTKARLLASRSTGSGYWLHALPSSSLGLRLSNDETRTAVGLRVGAPLVREHACVCGSHVECNGYHGLACRRSAGRQLRHRLANDVIVRAFRSCETPAELEPPRLIRGDGKRPDGATLIPWSRGKCLVWDFTSPDTMAPSHLKQSSMASGAAASVAEKRKRDKYSELATTYDFVPIAVETLGAWGADALVLTEELGGRIAVLTGESRSTSFLRQRLDMAIQRGNAAAIRGTMPGANHLGGVDFEDDNV